MRSRIIRIKSTTAYGADNKAGVVGIRAFVAGKELSPTNPDIQVRGKRNLRTASIEGRLPHEQSRRDGIPTAFPSASLVQFTSYVWQCAVHREAPRAQVGKWHHMKTTALRTPVRGIIGTADEHDGLTNSAFHQRARGVVVGTRVVPIVDANAPIDVGVGKLASNHLGARRVFGQGYFEISLHRIVFYYLHLII